MESLKDIPVLYKVLSVIVVVVTVLFMILTVIFKSNSVVFPIIANVTIGTIGLCGLIVFIRASILMSKYKKK